MLGLSFYSIDVVLLHQTREELGLEYVELRVQPFLAHLKHEILPHFVDVTHHLISILDLLDDLGSVMARDP